MVSGGLGKQCTKKGDVAGTSPIKRSEQQKTFPGDASTASFRKGAK